MTPKGAARNGIETIPTLAADVYAFRVTPDLDKEGLGEMASILNTAFDRHAGKVRVMIVMDGFEMSDAFTGISGEAIKAELRSLKHVSRYAVVGAPGAAAAMISAMDKIIPVDARAFDKTEMAQAWDFVGTRAAA